MLIREEKDASPALKCPAQHLWSVGGRADNTAVAPAERFEIGRRVHIRDRNYRREVTTHLILKEVSKGFPAFFDLSNVGHIGHGAAGGGIRKDDLLMSSTQDIGALGHKVDATEYDIVCLGMLPGKLRQLE